MNRKKELRPVLPNLVNSGTSKEEHFQNQIIRPILKMQHALLIVIFKKYAVQRKTNLSDLTDQRLKRFIESALSKDIPFKNMVIGIVIGQLSIEEYGLFVGAESDYKKRIIAIIKQRLKDNSLELF